MGKKALLFQKQKTKSIVWIQTSFLGDIVISTASYKRAKELIPGVKQYLITTPLGKAALKDHPMLDGVFVFDKKNKGSIESITSVKTAMKEAGVDLKNTICLQAHKSFRSSLLAKYLGTTTVTYTESSLSFMADLTIDRVSFFHEADRISLLMQGLGFSRRQIFNSRPFLPEYSSTDFGWFIDNKPVIAIAPGSVWGTKRWPATKFAELTHLILNKLDVNIVFLGAEAEKESVEVITATLDMKDKRVLNLVGKTSLDDLRAIYPKLTALVSNDSSPIHYASAFNVATIAVFGATTSAMGFGPLADDSSVVELSDLKCRPCSDHGPMVCPLKHFKCMKDISSGTVFRELESVIISLNGANELHKID